MLVGSVHPVEFFSARIFALPHSPHHEGLTASTYCFYLHLFTFSQDCGFHRCEHSVDRQHASHITMRDAETSFMILAIKLVLLTRSSVQKLYLYVLIRIGVFSACYPTRRCFLPVLAEKRVLATRVSSPSSLVTPPNRNSSIVLVARLNKQLHACDLNTGSFI